MQTRLMEWSTRNLRSLKKAVLSIYWLFAFAFKYAAGYGKRGVSGRVNVLHLAWKGNVSGVTNMVKNAVLAADVQRYKPLVCFIENGGPAADEFERLGIEVIVLDMPHFFVDTIGMLRGLMESKGIHILHAHGFKHSIYGRFAARMAGVPVVISHFHGGVKGEWRKLRPFGWLSLKMTDRIIAVSGAMKEEMTSGYYGYRAGPEKVVVMPNCVDTVLFSPGRDKAGAKRRLGIPDGMPVIGMVARLSREKGHDTLIDALRQLKEEGRPFVCLLAGKGPVEESLRERVDALGLSGDVVFLGERSDIHELLHALDIYVHPTLMDSFSISTAEAMASGLPVAASRVGGIPELVDDGINGRLFEPGDAKALKESIKDLMDNPEKTAMMAANAREKVETVFSKRAFDSSINRLYDSLIKEIFGQHAR